MTSTIAKSTESRLLKARQEAHRQILDFKAGRVPLELAAEEMIGEEGLRRLRSIFAWINWEILEDCLCNWLIEQPNLPDEVVVRVAGLPVTGPEYFHLAA